MKNTLSWMAAAVLLLFQSLAPAGAWDQLKNFPTQDVPYFQVKGGASVDWSALGYFSSQTSINPYGGVAFGAGSGVTGIPKGDPTIMRVTLALMDDALNPNPPLFPDWNPGGNWVSTTTASSPWVNAGARFPQVQLQYEELMNFANPGALVSLADYGTLPGQTQAGSLTVTHAAPPVAPATAPKCNTGETDPFKQRLAVYSAYGNAVQQYLPQTLADDGPLPVKDERAWPLPYDGCVP